MNCDVVVKVGCQVMDYKSPVKPQGRGHTLCEALIFKDNKSAKNNSQCRSSVSHDATKRNGGQNHAEYNRDLITAVT